MGGLYPPRVLSPYHTDDLVQFRARLFAPDEPGRMHGSCTTDGMSDPTTDRTTETANATGIPTQSDLTDAEKRANLMRLAFGGDEAAYERFCTAIREFVPPGTQVVLRGSAVTGKRWKDGSPFDADGPGTSDLDLTLVGDQAIKLFKITGFFVPGVHSRPVSDDDPEIAPELIPLRETLMNMVNRPVNIQASRDIVIQFRGDLLGQPYLVLLEKPDGADS
jgi:hypothetical protein